LPGDAAFDVGALPQHRCNADAEHKHEQDRAAERHATTKQPEADRPDQRSQHHATETTPRRFKLRF
jgi:hypothetical protein